MQAPLLIDLQTVLVTVALILPRVVVCLTILPGLYLRTLSATVRIAIGIAIALPASLPAYEFVKETTPDYILAVTLIYKEAMIGCMMGVMMSIPAWVAQSIGSITDLQRVPFPIMANNNSIDQDASALGGMMVQAVNVLMVQTGLFVALIRILIESYGVWPAYSLLPPFEPGHFDVVVARFGEFFWHVIVYGAPVVIPLLLVDFCFALIGVFAPNMQVTYFSSPVKSLVGIFILLVYWPTFSHYVAGDFARVLDLGASLMQAGSK